jgi:hypothetical protein
MRSSEDTRAKRETMTTGQAAKRLGISLASLRRRVDAGVIEAYREAKVVDTDIRGFKLRGHRRIFVDSVEAYERWVREQAASSSAAEYGPGSSSSVRHS